MRGFVNDDLEALLYTKLASSGLDLADGKRLGITAISATEVAGIGLWKSFPKPPAMVIPYNDPWGNVISLARYRALREPAPKPPRFPKYVQPRGSPVTAYFPPLVKNWKTILRDVSKLLIITEGELKAIKACKEGFHTIGLGGVWNFRKEKIFLDSLARITWKERKVYLAYDSDLATNEQVERARQTLANELIKHGAKVYRVDLPSISGAKTGLDDFLIAHGAEAFSNLLNDAAPMEADWRLLYKRSDKGAPYSNAANVCVALENALELQGVFAFDEMQRGVALLKAPPGANGAYPRPLEDTDISNTMIWLQSSGGLPHIGPTAVRDGVDSHAKANQFHPVRDWLNSLVWDKKKRLGTWMEAVFDVKPEVYTRKVGRILLLGMVARVMEPGCQMDYTVVFEGPQGVGKSSVLRILGGKWFSDEMPHPGRDDKRAAMHIRGKWMIEDSDLASHSRAGVEEMKQFRTRRYERFVPMYGHAEVTEPRQCVIVGTTNEHTYLRDDTGNRRILPIKVRISEAGTAWAVANRDQLFAEAFVYYRKHEPWWPDHAFEEKYMAPEQEARYSDTEWDDDITKYLAMKAVDKDPRVTTTEIMQYALEIPIKDRKPGYARKVGHILRRQGWESRLSTGGWHFVPIKQVRF